MPCGGCSGAITRVLTKQKDAESTFPPTSLLYPPILPISPQSLTLPLATPGVTDFTVSLKKQLVLVESEALDFEQVKEVITKTQKVILKEKEVQAGWKIPEAEEEVVEWEGVPIPVVL